MKSIEPIPHHTPTLLLRVEEAALRLGIGRTSMYRLVMSGEVESVQIGGLRRIPAPCLQEYVERLRQSASDPDPDTASGV